MPDAGGLLCGLGLHRRDDECRCARCGVTSHRPTTTRAWEVTEEVDATQEPWVRRTYEVETTRCRRCRAVLASSRTGREGWQTY